jgi:hypothetical protein
MTMTIKTNHVPRDIVYAWELTEQEQAEFDYLDWEAIERGEDSADFFRYRGQLYDLSEFSRITAPGSTIRHPMECQSQDLQGWDGYASDSFFSGIVVRYPRDERGNIDGEDIIVGTYYS